MKIKMNYDKVETINGTTEYTLNGKCHRLDGPAVEYEDGDKFWYQNDNLHRLDGPAIEWVNGDKGWWIDGKRLTEEEFQKIFNARFTKFKSVDKQN